MAIVSHATCGIAMVAFACKYRSDATKYLSVECGRLLIKILNFKKLRTFRGQEVTTASTTTKALVYDRGVDQDGTSGSSSQMSKLMWIGIGIHIVKIFFHMNLFK